MISRIFAKFANQNAFPANFRKKLLKIVLIWKAIVPSPIACFIGLPATRYGTFEYPIASIYNGSRKGRWAVWEKRKLTYMWIAKKKTFYYITLWSWKISSYGKANTGSAPASLYSKLPMPHQESKNWIYLRHIVMKSLILNLFKRKRLFCVLRPLVQLHSRLWQSD